MDDPKTRKAPPVAAAPRDPAILDTPEAVADDRSRTVATVAEPPVLDANGFDPHDFEWRPVLRRPRSDGWTPELQRRFVEALADTGIVADACRSLDISVQSAYRLRRSAGAESFARAWDAAVAAAATRLIDVAMTRAIDGVDIPVFDRDGCRIGSKRHYSDRLMMFLLRAYRPDRFRHAEQDTRPAAEPMPATPPLEIATATLGPVTPAEPHLLMPLQELADEIACLLDERDPAPVPLDRFVHPRNAPDHPKAIDRALRRHRREMERNGDGSDDE